MIQIRVNVIQHPFSSGMHNLYNVFIDGVLLCTTEDDNEGFNLMVAKSKVEALKWHERCHASLEQKVMPIKWG